MKERIAELDYLKGIFIVLMVVFHLPMIEYTYPVLREAVYTFHMSAFLIISGYLANVDKDFKAFGKGIMRIAVPYLIFETIYILLMFYLGKVMHTNNMISDLSVLGFFDRLAEYPTGPYWYLHTLVICTVVYYIIYKVLNLSKMTALVLTGVILYGLSLIIAGLIWDNVIYFLIGVFIFRSGKTFTHMISPSAFAVIPLVILFLSPANFHNGSLAGIAITILMISFLLFLYKYCPSMLSRLFTYLGKNSLAIVVFSPLFTVVSKYVMPYFSFDPTSICFYIVATIFVVACCLVCAKLFDVLRLSRFIFIKEKFYVNY